MNERAPFLLAGVLIGALFTLQIKSEVTPATSYALDEYTFQQQLLASYVEEQEELEATLSAVREQVDVAESTVSDLYGAIDAEAVEAQRAALGGTELIGSGVEIVLDDSEAVANDSAVVESGSLVHASDLRDVINLLRTFPYEGLAINDQRILPSSSIQSAGNTILINNFTVAPPFTIRILTEVPDLVIQSVSHEIELPSIYARVTSNGLQFKFKKNDELTIPAYLGGSSLNHVTPANDET